LALQEAIGVLQSHLEEPGPEVVGPRLRMSRLAERLVRRRGVARHQGTLHQYWDAAPPREIQQLFSHNEGICRKLGVEHRVWRHESARDLLQALDREALEAYDCAPHPAMKSDIFRLAVVHEFGGVYLDADMGLSPRGDALWRVMEDVGFVFKWTEGDRLNAPNWCFGFPAGHPCLELAIRETGRSIVEHAQRSGESVVRGILSISGPGRFSRIVGTYLKRSDGSPALRVFSVKTAYRWVMNGPAVLRQPLDYKSTERHWKIAAERFDGAD
jgi:mannosyltransferase OCH1-like enzyme